LLQAEEVVRAPMAGQLLGNFRRAFVTPPIAPRRQPLRVAFPGHDRPHDRQAGRPVQVGHRAMHTDVHLVQALLHPAAPIAPLGNQGAFVPHQRPQQAHLLERPKGSPQQATTVETLNPFTVAAIALRAPRDTAQFPRIHEHHLEARAFEHFVRHDPVHARALQRHRRDAARGQPRGQLLDARCRRGKYGHLAAAAGPRRRTDPMLLAPHIDASDIRAQHREAFRIVARSRWIPAILHRHHLVSAFANTTARVGSVVNSRLGECHDGPRHCSIPARSHAAFAASGSNEDRALAAVGSSSAYLTRRRTRAVTFRSIRRVAAAVLPTVLTQQMGLVRSCA
jgi:hypothetical protein